MIDKQSVLNALSNLPELTHKDLDSFPCIIDASINYIIQNLKPGVDTTANKQLLSLLAAAIAYHKFIIIQETTNSCSSIKLGDVSISSTPYSSIKMAKNLKNEFLALASHLLISPHFIFRQV